MIGALVSVLKRTLPDENFLTASSGFAVTVPFLGFGINPLGPNILANLTNFGISVGAAIKTSKSILPASMAVITLSSTMATLTFLPVPWGKLTSPFKDSIFVFI